MLASLTSPNSTKDHILCYVLWMALVYTIDDIRDRFIIDDEDSIGNHAVSQFTYLWRGFAGMFPRILKFDYCAENKLLRRGQTILNYSCRHNLL